MRNSIAALALALAIPAGAGTQDGAQTGAAMPEWYGEHVDYMTRDGGRWVADNSEYRSDEETADHYVIVFRPEFGGASMSARLFGVTDGEESADYWHFTGYWDPVANEAVLMQTGWGGGLGIGATWPVDEGSYRSEQVFSSPGGPVRTEAHIFTVTGPDEHVTRTLRRTGDEAWTEGRTYTWLRGAQAD